MVERLMEVEYKGGEGLVLKFKHPRFRTIPESAREHVVRAQKEVLLALRSSLDAAIEVVEEVERKREKTRTKIEVQ